MSASPKAKKRRYVVDYVTTVFVSVEAWSRVEALKLADEQLEKGSQREWTAQMWENLQLDSVTDEGSL